MYASTPVSLEGHGWTGKIGSTTVEPTETEKRMLELKEHFQRQMQGIYVPTNPQTERTDPMSNRRIVQVFIADPDINVPLDSALIYKSEPKFTDASDQELYFEVPIVELLKTHNEKRGKWQDKEATKKSGREVFLEPAKIRDLKMVVVNIAQF